MNFMDLGICVKWGFPLMPEQASRLGLVSHLMSGPFSKLEGHSLWDRELRESPIAG